MTDTPGHLTPQQRMERKLDRVLTCLEGEPLMGKPGLVHRVGESEGEIAKLRSHIKGKARFRSKLVTAAGVGMFGACGAWLWSLITGRA